MSPDIGDQCVSPTNSTLITNFATNTKFIDSTSGVVFIVQQDGVVKSWGDATCGILGNGTSIGRATTPSLLPGLTDVTSLKTGNYFAIARDKTGSVYTWGSDTDSALGLGPTPTYDLANCDVQSGSQGNSSDPGANTTPRKVPGLADIVNVGADQLTAFAIDSAGRLYYWGLVETPQGQANLDTPTLVTPLPPVNSVVGAGLMAFALARDGSVWGFGSNDNGNFGDGRTTPVPTPTQVPGLSNVVQIAGDSISGAAALLRDGTVKLWNGSTYRTPTTPATVHFCTVPNSTSSTCIQQSTGPIPPMRSISGAGFQLTFTATDGTVYIKRPSQNDFFTIAPASF